MNILRYIYVGFISTIKFIVYFFKYFIIGLFTIITIIPRYLIIGIKFIFAKKNSSNIEHKEIEKKIIPTTILSLSVMTYLISVFILTRWYVQSERTKNFTNDLTQTMIKEETTETENQEQEQPENETTETDTNSPNQYKDTTTVITPPTKSNTTSQQKVNTNFISTDLNYYLQKNSETVAWLQVNGTKVNYPVVQHTDNNFYLKHDFYKRKTSTGWIFADYRNNFQTFDNNTIIYAHNLINNTMFGTLPYLLKSSFFNNKNNHYIKLSTQNTNSVWQIFSVYKTDPTADYLQTKFNSTTKYQDFLNMLANRSYYNFNLDLNYTDKIITLSTCTESGTKRIAVHAKLIKIESK